MSYAEATRLAILGTISEFPKDKQEVIQKFAQTIRDLIAQDEIPGLIALALVGNEQQVRAEKED